MIIMQTLDAAARRKYIESKKLLKVIFSHSHDDVECVQYHPKDIAGKSCQMNSDDKSRLCRPLN